jgi:hypothetical protein
MIIAKLFIFRINKMVSVLIRKTIPLICVMQIKWICPTAPTRPMSLFGGFPSTACMFDCFVGYPLIIVFNF